MEWWDWIIFACGIIIWCIFVWRWCARQDAREERTYPSQAEWPTAAGIGFSDYMMMDEVDDDQPEVEEEEE